MQLISASILVLSLASFGHSLKEGDCEGKRNVVKENGEKSWFRENRTFPKIFQGFPSFWPVHPKFFQLQPEHCKFFQT